MISTNLKKWNEWFAGVTDGDGYFYINAKEKSISFEITTHILDCDILRNIKNQLKGGSIKIRSNTNSVRYRVKEKRILLDIINRLNGKIYDAVRLQQFSKVCEILKISQIQAPSLLEKQNAYLAGLIDSDGTLTINISKVSSEDSQKKGVEGKIIRLINSRSHCQITLKITSTDKQKILLLKDSYGIGSIYEEKPNKKNKSPKPKYHWTIRSKNEFILLNDILLYFLKAKSKKHRMRLVFYYFKYKELKYHLKPSGTPEFKVWEKFCKLWFRYSF